MIRKCHLCGCLGEAQGKKVLRCFRCGTYTVTAESFDHAHEDHGWTPTQIANASGWMFEHQGVVLDEGMLTFLSRLPTPSPSDKAHKLLRYCANICPGPGDEFTDYSAFLDEVLEHARRVSPDDTSISSEAIIAIKSASALPFLSCCSASDKREIQFLFNEYLKDHLGFIKNGSGTGRYIITPSGWDHLSATEAPSSKSNDAFVAMWFDEKTNDLWTQAIYPGLLNAGYKPVRIDKLEHINKIDDEIVAAIRRCRVVVADFTGQRGGVYFEAGFALGLNKPVIWVCRYDQVKEIHFDTRQYNFLLWKPGDYDGLKNALKNRIEASVGRGDG